MLCSNMWRDGLLSLTTNNCYAIGVKYCRNGYRYSLTTPAEERYSTSMCNVGSLAASGQGNSETLK